MTSSQRHSSPWGLARIGRGCVDATRLARYVARLMGDPRVPGGAKAKVLAAGLYAYIDNDLVSDTLRIVPGLGYADDIAMAIHAIVALIRDAGPDLAAEHWPGDEASFRRTLSALVWLDSQLYGRLASVARRIGRWLLGMFIPAVNQRGRIP